MFSHSFVTTSIGVVKQNFVNVTLDAEGFLKV